MTKQCCNHSKVFFQTNFHKERLYSNIENDKLECKECGSLNFDGTNVGYACRECGVVIEEEKFDCSPTPNYYNSTLKNGFGNKKGESLPFRSRLLKRLDSIPSNNEERVNKQAEIEAKRILSNLKLPASFSPMVCYKFRKIFKSGRVNRRNRGAKTLIPAIIFYCLKSWNFTVRISEILSVSNLEKKKFNAVLGAIQKFFLNFNNIYLSGCTKSYGGTDKDACITKFNSTLDFQWYKLYNGDQNYDSVAYGIAMDSEDNLAMTGVSDNDAFVSMYSQLPSEFALACDKTNPVPDGSFNLSWSEALDAQNYSIYQYDDLITQINDSLAEIIRGNTNRTYSFNNYAEGTYYFISVAFNRYGNASSNCLQVIVQSVPGEFTLFEHAEDPDTDGSVNLTWTESIGADNYSVYRYNGQGEFSTLEIGPDWTLIEEEITDLDYEIQDLGNGDHNFSICAENEAGERLSNAIEVIVRRVSDSFTLYSDASDPDDNGKYQVIWEASEYTTNYTLYFSESFISEINGGVKVLLNGYIPDFVMPTYSYLKEEKDEEKYYYRVLAENDYGSFLSNCLEVKVEFEEEDSEETEEDPEESKKEPQLDIIPYVTLFSVAGLFSGIGTIYYLGKKRGILKR